MMTVVCKHFLELQVKLNSSISRSGTALHSANCFQVARTNLQRHSLRPIQFAMRSLVITLLVVSSLLACFQLQRSSIGISAQSMTTEQKDRSAKRMLRTPEELYLLNLMSKWRRFEEKADHPEFLANVFATRFWVTFKMNVDKVFAKLKLDSGVNEAIFSPKLTTMDKFVDLFNKKNPGKRKSLLTMLTSRYNEVDVALALASKSHTRYTAGTAYKLLDQQLKGWIKSQKSVDEVFTLLKFRDDGALEMVSPKLTILESFINLFNARYTHQHTSLFETLYNGFGKPNFAHVLARAMKTGDGFSTAFKYSDMIFERWTQGNKNVEPIKVLVEVFKIEEANLRAGTLKKPTLDAYKWLFKGALEYEKSEPEVLAAEKISLSELSKWVKSIDSQPSK